MTSLKKWGKAAAKGGIIGVAAQARRDKEHNEATPTGSSPTAGPEWKQGTKVATAAGEKGVVEAEVADRPGYFHVKFADGSTREITQVSKKAIRQKKRKAEQERKAEQIIFAGVVLDLGREEIRSKDSSGPVRGAKATWSSETHSRMTAGRRLEFGLLAAQKKEGHGTLVVEGDGFVVVTQVPITGSVAGIFLAQARKNGLKGRSVDEVGFEFAARINQAAGSADSEQGHQSAPSISEELMRLAQLRDQGILTDDEFAGQKAKLLG